MADSVVSRPAIAEVKSALAFCVAVAKGLINSITGDVDFAAPGSTIQLGGEPWGLCLFRHARLALFFYFGKLAPYDAAGPASWLYIETDAFTSQVTPPMTCLESRTPEFSTVKARCFW